MSKKRNMTKRQRIYYEVSDSDVEMQHLPEFNAEQIRQYQELNQTKSYHPHDTSKYT
jgi:hypothetical protein